MNSESKLPPAEAPITFRYEPVPADRQAVRAIVQSTDVFNATEVDTAVELVDERLSKGPASGYHFVFAEREGEMLGYTCYGPIALTAGSYDLYWIAVSKSSQGLGLGRILLQKSEELVRQSGGRRIYIETSNRHDYTPTRMFYLRCGYTQEAVLKDFYAPGDDKVIYSSAIG
jgi:D-alanine-D-alanine ligase